MSTNTLTKSETSTVTPKRRPTRVRYAVASAILGLASVGAVVVTTVGGGSNSPAPRAPTPAPTMFAPPSSEVFPGCINDIECTGEPSRLPPGYWDVPFGSVD